MLEPLTAAVLGAVAKKGVDFVAEAVASAAKGPSLVAWKTKERLHKRHATIRKLRLVKTLWQAEKAIDLATFFVPPFAMVKQKRTRVVSLDNLKETHCLVEGTVGQGKSILLRYLASMEVHNRRALPIFTELRRVAANQSLQGRILEDLSGLGFDIDWPTFEVLASSGKIALFLDAFDEVAEERREEIRAAIDDLCTHHPNLPIVVSSRPSCGIAESTALAVVPLCPLNLAEAKEVITKAEHDEYAALGIIKGIEAQGRQISQLLTTPLMVALLVFKYRASGAIPENEVAFYGDLFPLLLRRHDRHKGGYERPRKSKLSDDQLGACFDGVCYATRKIGKGVFSRQDMLNIVTQAAQAVAVPTPPDVFLRDISQITCLLLEEGSEFRFIHKSIQEFHAASFIRSRPDAQAEMFYAGARRNGHVWDEELRFLSQIDRHRFNKHLYLPLLYDRLWFTGTSMPADWSPSDTLADDAVSKGGYSVALNSAGLIKWRLYEVRAGPPNLVTWRLFEAFTKALGSFFADSLAAKKFATGDAKHGIKSETRISFEDLYNSAVDVPKLRQAMKTAMLELRDEAISIQQAIANVESPKDLFAF